MQLVSESLHDHEIELFARESGEQLAEAIEQHYKKDNINEAAALLAISTVLAAPVFLKIIGTLIKKGAKLLKWKGGENGGKWLQNFAHKMEKKLQQPIYWTLKKLGVKDKDKREKWTKGIFALIIILLGVYSGIEAMHAYKAANISKSGAESLLTALKATETGETMLAGIESAGAAAANSKGVVQKTASTLSVLFSL